MDPIVLAGIAAVVIPSITSHETMHGFAADRLGDPTARQQGRLTLNPLPHIDLVFTILLPAILLLFGSGVIFGGAKPVPVNVTRLRNPRRDWALVGAAGPLTNVALAFGLSALLAILVHSGMVAPIRHLHIQGLAVLRVVHPRPAQSFRPAAAQLRAGLQSSSTTSCLMPIMAVVTRALKESISSTCVPGRCRAGRP
jgi:hypothetical protein